MFGKKVLSLIGLLFLGSQISSVYADCTIDTSNCSLTDECIESQFGYNQVGTILCNVEGVSTSSIVNSIGYFKAVDGNYYSRNHAGTVSDPINPDNTVSSATDCSGHVGSLIENGGKVYLCLSDDKSVELKATGSGEHYLMDKAAGNIFTTDNNDNNVSIVIKDGDNALIFDTNYEDEEYCVYSSNLVLSREDQFCKSSILDNMYECTDGLCEKTSSPVEAGNYVVSNKLYICSSDVDGNGNPLETVTCIHDKEGTLNGLVVVEKTSNDDNYEFEIGRVKSDLTGISNIANVELYLYDCKDGECQRTDGFVKHATSLASTAFCANDDKCVAAADDLTIEGVAIIDYTNFKLYDVADTGKATSKITIEVGKEYLYRKDDTHIAIIKSVSDEEGVPSPMVVGVAKYVDGTVIAHTETFEITDSCRVNKESTYTISGGAITSTVACVINEPCDLNSSGAQHCTRGGYYLKDDVNLAGTSTVSGTLYYCNDQDECGVASGVGTGLYKNADTITEGRPDYISCSDSATGCLPVTIKTVTTDNDCNTGGVVVGDIISYTNGDTGVTTLKLCLTGEASAKTVLLSSSDGAQTDLGSEYIISIDTANAFGDGSSKFVIIEASDDGKTILKKASTIKYKYTNEGLKIRYRNDKSDVCNANGTVKATINEYKLVSDSEYESSTAQ